MRPLLPVILISLLCLTLRAEPVRVDSLAAFASAAAQDGQEIVMAPGSYALDGWITDATVREKRQRGDWPLLTINGSRNRIRLDGVEWTLDVSLLNRLNAPVHTDGIVVAGHSNLIHGLKVRCHGEGSAPGGALFAVRGVGNTVSNLLLRVHGSSPYGYGDLFGKGAEVVIGHRKHCGLRITGDGTRVLRTVVRQHAFGHAFFIQEDAADVYLADCLAEGETRRTDDMLRETSGPAFEKDFRTIAPNRQGEHRVTPGYRKSLAEDGFRTYGTHRNLVFERCVARGMRGGFELRTPTGVRLSDCVSEGNERGFWLDSEAVATGCSGDAVAGPLLILEGSRIRADVRVQPAPPVATVHALALIAGADNRVLLDGGSPQPAAPILIGYGVPMMGEGMAPIPEADARRLDLVNRTPHPVRISARAHFSTLTTPHLPEVDAGKGTRVKGP